MKNKRYIDADALIAYLSGWNGMQWEGLTGLKVMRMAIDAIECFTEKTGVTAGLDWRSPDVWPRKEEADSHGYVLAVNRDDGYISSWPAASIISRPDTFCYWAPVPKLPDEPMRPQEDKDGQG